MTVTVPLLILAVWAFLILLALGIARSSAGRGNRASEHARLHRSPLSRHGLDGPYERHPLGHGEHTVTEPKR